MNLNVNKYKNGTCVTHFDDFGLDYLVYSFKNIQPNSIFVRLVNQ